MIVLAGAIMIPGLPVALYPDLAPPQVNVSCVYIGANAAAVEHDVTTILEESINGVEGMRYMTSTSGNDGVSSINITFRTGYDLNVAAIDVQNRVAEVQGRLPAAVNQAGVTITKANPNFVFGAGVYSDGNRYTPEFMSNYLDVYVKDSLKRVPGVGDVQIFGERKYAMRIWLDPVRLAARQLTATDVVGALQEQNLEMPAGAVGQQPTDAKQDFQIAVNVSGRLTDPQEFGAIILKNTPAGIVRLRDVGRAEVGAEDYGSSLNFSGYPAVGIGVQQLSSANALSVDTLAKAKLAELEKSFPPGMHIVVAFDSTTVVGESIHEVLVTLAEAIVIVIIVIFLFLQDWKATIIPAVTIPVSLIGTFFFIRIFGFSVNSLTLFGITLATGLVVDDAIVVIENVQRHITEGIADAHEATSVAMGEVTSAVIATSLVLISVFVPVSFFPGSTGILYKQFSLTIAFSIAISAFNALTLSPALSALLIHREKRHHGLLGLMARLMKDASRWYAGTIHAVLRHKKKIAGLFVAGLAATVWIYNHVPTAFVPDEDQGYFMLQVLAPQGASLAYTSNLGKQAQEIVQQNPDVFGTFSVMGFGFSGAVPNQGIIFVPLKPQSERKGNAHSAKAIVAGIQPKLFQIPGGIVAAFEPPAVNGIGNFGGFQFELQDNGRNTLDDLARVAHTIVGSSRQDALLDGLYTGFTANDPQIKVTIDREKAKAMGVPLTQLADTLGVFMGSEYINDFDFNNRSYRVYVQAESQFRNTMRSLRQFYVRSATGQMVPLDTLIAAQESSGPQIISHYNLFRSAEILGSSSPGHSSGEGLAEMEKLAKKNMMQGMSFEWSGLALEEIESNGKMMLIFGLGIVGVYLTLSAQYESFALPFIILLAVPMAVLGALGAVSLRGLDNNIYVQIGLVLLIGLAAKNSILIVEFAEQIRATGKSIEESAILAAELRLRPILMTSFAFILGVLPLVFATGAGMVGRHSVGTAVVGGMLVSTMLNLIFIPVLYVLLKTGLERFTRRGKTLPESESGAQ